MVVFQDIENVQEWLESLDWVAFWDAIAPYNLPLQSREVSEALVASGQMDQGQLLGGLKILAEVEITSRFGLTYRSTLPLAAETLASIH
ncbi:MAG: hypothetical protein AAGE76_01275 [Pseudomonadota bacterium]